MIEINQLNNQIHLISAFKTNDSVALKQFYVINYHKIEAFILSNNGSKEHAKDVYQEAFLAVWRNIKDDKFQSKNQSSLNGYLYTIAKNKWMDYLRSKDYRKTTTSLEFSNYAATDLELEKNNDDNLKNKRLHITMNAFKNLGEPCKSLLSKFYFEKRSMKDIANELKLNAASTRNKKYRCMRKLKELALKIEY